MGPITMNLQRFMPKWMISLFQGNAFYNNSYLLGQRGPVWISVIEPYDLYNSIPELRAVIDRKGAMFSNMKIYKRDKASKKPIPDPQLDLLLDNPNCTQSQNQFLKQYLSQLDTYGNAFIYRNKLNLKQYPVSLWPVSAFYLQPVLTGRLFDQTSMGDIIKGYKMINTMTLQVGVEYKKEFAPEEVLFTRISDLNNPLIGKSPIACLKFPLSNLKTSYMARNVGQQMTGVGLVSPKAQKDMSGSPMPLNQKQREEQEKQFGDNYGITDGQRKTILSNAAVDFQSLSIELDNMLLLEGAAADLAIICNVLHVNPNMFLTGQTYENLRSAIIQTYQDTIIPAADEFMQALGPFIGLKDNEELCASFEHLSILKENKLKGMQAIQSIVASLTQAVQGGILDAKTASSILETELGLNAASY